MISKVNNQGVKTIFDSIDSLIQLAKRNKDMLVVKQMKAIVTEYKSKNSAYEKLDVYDLPH